MRLIDADALKEQILDWISEQVVSKYISHDACMATREGARVAFNLLNDAPTIDAAPVVRGEWGQCSAFDEDENVYTCSVCGEPWTLFDGTPQENNMHYCPNCGAKMEDKT